MKEEKKKKRGGRFIGIAAVVLIPIFVALAFNEEKERIKQTQPVVKYGPVEVLEETPFTLKAGESKIFSTRRNGVGFVYTVKWTQFNKNSYIKGSIHGVYGADGADRISQGTIHPHINVSQPPGSGEKWHVYPKNHYLRLENLENDTVSGVFQRWGRRVISTTVPQLEK